MCSRVRQLLLRPLMDARELKETAHQLHLKQKFAQSAEVYAELTAMLPSDPQVWLKHADACRRAQNLTQAVASYRRAARAFSAQGYMTRAMAVLRVALEVEPKNERARGELLRLQEYLRGTPSSTQPTQPQIPAVEPRGHQIKRISPYAVAFRPEAGVRWMLVHSRSPIELEEGVPRQTLSATRSLTQELQLDFAEHFPITVEPPTQTETETSSGNPETAVHWLG
jgi:hypothetical protein